MIAVAVIAGGVLILWNVSALAEFMPAGWSDMSPLTAAGLLFAAGSIALTGERSSGLAVRAGEIAALVVFALGAAILGADLTGATSVANEQIALPSPQTAAGLTMVGMCLALMRMRSAPLNAADVVGVMLLALVIFMSAGHLFNATFVEAHGGRILSVQTLVCLIALGFVIGNRLALRGGLVSFLVHPGQGGRIARIALPFAIAFPFVSFVAVELFDQTGFLPATMTQALIVPTVVLGSLAVIGWMGHRIYSLERSLRIQSVTDELTKTLNRRGFMAVADNVVHSAKRSGTPLVLSFFDMDGLKVINDTQGHDIGSEVIERFAKVLKSTFRKSDVIARIGGDEFVVLASGDAEDARRLVERLDEKLDDINRRFSKEQRAAYSLGFSEVDVESDTGLHNAMARADAFMYEQKRLKKRSRESATAPVAVPSSESPQAA